MPDITIAHLSDLHLGNDFFWRSVKNLRWYARKDDERLIRQLADALGKLQPDYVVISGDIVNKSTPKNFARAAELLGSMLAKANINLAKVLIVPGNHDAPVLPKDHEVFERASITSGASASSALIQPSRWAIVPVSRGGGRRSRAPRAKSA